MKISEMIETLRELRCPKCKKELVTMKRPDYLPDGRYIQCPNSECEFFLNKYWVEQTIFTLLRFLFIPDVVHRNRRMRTQYAKSKRMCPPGHEYCYQCEHIDRAELFYENNKCPNPKCPNPKDWND